MAKRTAEVARPAIPLDQALTEPLYRQIYARLRQAILAGQLETGARLPSTRALAGELGVSRTTTALAYELLLLEGYIESRVGDGTRVAPFLPAAPAVGRPATPPAARADDTAAPPALVARALPAGTNAATLAPDWEGGGAQPFRIGAPEVAHFPFATWGRLVARHARRSLPALALSRDGRGHGPLREAIVAHIGVTRGVRCAPEQVIVTTGAQAALDLIARVLIAPGDAAWVEDPGYPGARGALRGAGARLVPVPVDRAGLDVAAGRRRCPGARLAMVTPSHQFPTGVTLDLPRRLALLAWADEAGAWIVEDDYDSEYRYGGRPLEALQGLDQARRVIYVGTFSKVLFPALRLGYLVAPPALLDRFLAARHLIDVHSPLLEQLALAEFLAAGHFARYLRKMRLLYLARRDAVATALARGLGGRAEVDPPDAGLHLVAWLPPGVDAQRIAAAAAEAGLLIAPISRYSARPLDRDGLMLGFARATPDTLGAGVAILARALRAG